MQRCITFQDIKKRLVLVDESVTGYRLMKQFNESVQEYTKLNKRPEDIVRKIECGCKAKFLPPIDYLIEMYESLYFNPKSTTGNIKTAAKYIVEDAAPKVKSASELQDSIKRRMAYTKGKAKSKVNKALNVVKNDGKVGDKTDKQETVNGNNTKDKKTKRNDLKEEAYTDGYNRMLEAAEINKHCYRIIDNYNKISKRFNIDGLIRENTVYNGVYDTVLELCKLIDTYEISPKAKYNITLESAYYGFSSAHYPFTKKEIAEAATFYFSNIFGYLEMCSSVLEDSLIYDDEDVPPEIEAIHEEEPEDNEYGSSLNDIGDEIQEYAIYRAGLKSKAHPELVINEETDFNKVFTDWKKDNDDIKDNSFKNLINTIYVKTPNEFVEGAPKILAYLRGLVIVGSIAIHPIVAAVMLIADYVIKHFAEKDQITKMVKFFRSEIKTTETKIDTCKDEEEKKRLQEYLESCKYAMNKIEEEHNELVEDEDNDDDYDFDDDDDMFESSFLSLCDVTSKYISLSESARFPNVNYTFMKAMGPVALFDIAKFVSRYPQIYDISKVKSLYEGYYEEVSKNSLLYTEKSFLKQSLEYIDNPTPIKNESSNLYDNLVYYMPIVEGMSAIQDLINTEQYNNPLTEASFINTVKTAAYKLKKSMQNLNDKQKSLCRKFDSEVNVFTKKAKDAVTNDNREAIVKGSLLPSASKLIKMGITGAGLCILGQPVVAIIGALAYIACNKATQAGQRQQILDEIEIELKMCDKNIEEADNKNDKKALKQLYTIQRSLQRQQQKIKYHMNIQGQPVHDVHPNND